MNFFKIISDPNSYSGFLVRSEVFYRLNHFQNSLADADSAIKIRHTSYKVSLYTNVDYIICKLRFSWMNNNFYFVVWFGISLFVLLSIYYIGILYIVSKCPLFLMFNARNVYTINKYFFSFFPFTGIFSTSNGIIITWPFRGCINCSLCFNLFK